MDRSREIREVRKSLGVTQKKCAELMGVNSSTWGGWERGSAPMRDHQFEYFMREIGRLLGERHTETHKLHKEIKDALERIYDKSVGSRISLATLTHISRAIKSINLEDILKW